MSDKPALRFRFQFRLRTLMIVVTLLAVPLGYVGWQAKSVRERKAWLESHPYVNFTGYWPVIVAAGDPSQDPSVLRQWLGDEIVENIDVHFRAVAPSDLPDVMALFPEAQITNCGPPDSKALNSR